MEAFPATFCKGVRTYWRRRRYQRLDGSTSARKKSLRIVRFGGEGGDGQQIRRRLWRMRRSVRLRVRFLSPFRLLGRLRDAYVNAMLVLAEKVGSGSSGFSAPEAFWGKRVPKSRTLPTKRGEFERRMALEIYKSMLPVQELAA